MIVQLNGEPRELAPGATVGVLVDEFDPRRRGVAVAIDAEVVPRSSWDERELSEGERIELVHAIQGG